MTRADFLHGAAAAGLVPLRRGQVDPAIVRDIRADYRDDYSVHVAYVPHKALAEDAVAPRLDVQTLRKLLTA